jgi:hypothetical protein
MVVEIDEDLGLMKLCLIEIDEDLGYSFDN